MFRQGFTCPALLKDPCRPYAYGAVTRSGTAFQLLQLNPHKPLAWSPFARHY
jgi:hypothetical protein